MNTETGLSAIYAKTITPLVKGDEVKWYRNDTWITATVKNEKANTMYPGQLHTDKAIFSDVQLSYFGVMLVSFAARPNTGTQPVGDDVFVEINGKGGNDYVIYQADILNWDKFHMIKTWKPNHEAMLAKFKEQGANTMFTGKKAEEATHIIGKEFKKIIPGNMPEYLNDDGVWVMSNFDVKWLLIHPESTKLSRPPGERKEDHTDENGVVTYALAPVRQYNDQEAELATHFSGNNNRFYIKGYGANRKSMVLNDVGRWIRSDCTTNAELNGDEFWKLDYYGSDQVIETWVGDHITCPGKPVFTQEQADAGELPPIGSMCLFYFLPYRGEDYGWFEQPVYGYKDGKVISDHSEVGGRVELFDKFKPIDNRTDDQKCFDDLNNVPRIFVDDVHNLITDIKAGKIHGVKWSV